MALLLTALKALKNNPWIIVVILLFVLGATVKIQRDRMREKDADIERISSNYQEIQNKTVQELNLTTGELKKAISDKTELGMKVDSLLTVIDAKSKQVREITVIKTVYKDTTIVQASTDKPVKTETGYTIPVSYFSDCWSMMGTIVSTDPGSVLNITQRSFITEASVVEVIKRRWIFWKKRQYRVLTNCGELKVVHIRVVK